MDPSDRPSFAGSKTGFLLWVSWLLACLALFLWNIPPHPSVFRYLVQSFQYSQGSWAQVGETWWEHLLVLLAFLGCLVVFLGTGNRCLKGFKGGTASRLSDWLWWLALGWIFWGLLAEGLAFENLLYPSALKVLLVSAFVGFLLRDGKEALRRCWPLDARPEIPPGWTLPLGLVGLLSLANLLAPEMSWDAMTYQLILPRFYLAAHGFYPVVGIVPAHYPSLGQMFFEWGLVWGNDSIARSFCFLAHLATALALVEVGRRLENPKVGWTAAVLYWVFPYLNLFSTRGYVDLFTNFYAVLGLGFLAAGVAASGDGKPQRAEGVLASVALGATWALKYNAAGFWAAGLVLLWKMPRREKGALWAAYFLGPVFFFLPWALKGWAATNDPVFPFFPDWFHAFGWTAFDQKVSAIKFHFEGWKGLLKLPAVLWGIFFHNYSGAPNEEVGLAPLILLPLLMLKGKPMAWRGPVGVAVLVPFLFWLVTSHQLRLISEVIAFVALLAAQGYHLALGAWPSLRRTVQALVGVLLGISAYYLFQGLVEQPDPFANFLGVQSRDQFLSGVLRPEGYVPLAKYLNAQLPFDARVLILGQQNGYYLDRISSYDFDYTYPVLKKWSESSSTPEGLYLEFKKNGFTHILYNANSMMGAAIRADELGVDRYPWRPAELRKDEQFFLKYTRRLPLPVGGGYSLYEVGPRPGFSPLPDMLPGTEAYYLKELQALLGLPRLADIVGRSLSADLYVKAYREVSRRHPEIGWPCFQWAFAGLTGGMASPREALESGKAGFQRNGDEASWDCLRADVDLIQGKPASAVPLLEEASRLSPEREDVARNLATAYYNEHNLEKAAAEARRAADLAPFSEDYQRLARQLQAITHPH